MANKGIKKVSFVSKLFSKFLICVVLLLGVLIALKASPSLREKLYKYVFQNHFSFAEVNSAYEKLFGSSLPLTGTDKTALVSSTKIEYVDSKSYKDGVELTVSENYVIPVIKSGIVVFAGEKEGYGNTVVIQQGDGVEVWYANIKEIKVSMYDYLKTGDILGEANGKKMYLVFTKEGENLDYKKYI